MNTIFNPQYNTQKYYKYYISVSVVSKDSNLIVLADTSAVLDTSLKRENSHDFDDEAIEDVNLPPKDDLQILLNRIEMQLPKDDHVKYDSR